ncbi:MAG: hypothetical protein IJK74_03100 [Bacteroidales bacterium]|nr:hypothetical protein [Bacteroidales bacterium]
MKQIALSIAIIAAIATMTLLSSCKQNQQQQQEEANPEAPMLGKPSEVNYTIAKNYFIKNGAELPATHKITDQETFNQIFGMATTMGENGKPTEIDFDKDFVIAVETGLVQKETELIPSYLINHYDGQLVFHYTVKQGTDISYTIRPVLAIIVDKEYENLKIKVVQNQ